MEWVINLTLLLALIVFVKILNEIREGIVTSDTERRLRSLSRTPIIIDGIQPTEL
jgi:hypothetical protein